MGVVKGIMIGACKGCGCQIKVAAVGRKRTFCGKPECYAKFRTPKPCVQCGKPFAPKNPKQTLCSVACKNASLSVDAYHKHCAICQKPFSSPYATTQCCSQRCVVVLRSTKAEIPSERIKAVTKLMDGMPTELHQLADWFRGLTHEQLETVWVQAVIEQFAVGQIGALANALAVVRGMYRVKLGTARVLDRAMVGPQKVQSSSDGFRNRESRSAGMKGNRRRLIGLPPTGPIE